MSRVDTAEAVMGEEIRVSHGYVFSDFWFISAA